MALKRHFALKKLDAPLTFGFAAVMDCNSRIAKEFLSGIMKATADYGVHFINMADTVRHSVLEDGSVLPRFVTKMQFMHAPLLNGLITWTSSLADYADEQKIQSLFSELSPLPMVDIGYLAIPHVPSIRTDNAHAMRLIVGHFAEKHGFSRIAFAGLRNSKPHRERAVHFEQSMKELQLPCDDGQIFLFDSLDELASAPFVENDMAFQAIVAANDTVALHLIKAFETQGVAVPDDVAITGYNNQFAGMSALPPLSTIDLACFERGYRAVELLIDRIIYPDVPRLF